MAARVGETHARRVSLVLTSGGAHERDADRRSERTIHYSGGATAAARPWWLALLDGLVSQAAQATEADRGRAALLAAVSHDLRTPLAAAKAAVSGLRSGDVPVTADDRDELLATAEESLDQLVKLAASLLDVSRLQAGAQAVFPRPADLGEIVADSLDALGRGRGR